jgi:hypothetical protein
MRNRPSGRAISVSSPMGPSRNTQSNPSLTRSTCRSVLDTFSCELCRGAHQGSAAAGGSAFVDGCEQDQRARDDHGLVPSGARFSRPDIPSRICARGWILRKLFLRLAGRPGRNATGLLQSDEPEIDHGRDERHRRGGSNPFDRAGVVGAANQARRRSRVPGGRKRSSNSASRKATPDLPKKCSRAVNAGWMNLGVEGTEHVAGTTSARDVFEAARNAAKA